MSFDRSAPRGNTQRRRMVTAPATGRLGVDRRRRAKARAAGACWHCNKPCAPYYECEERRAAARERYHAKKRTIIVDDPLTFAQQGGF